VTGTVRSLKDTATMTAATRVSRLAMIAVGATPESNAVRADASSALAVPAGNSPATAVAPPILSPASAVCAAVSPAGTVTFAR
jgi:hypothetical protein